ncbi:hypothetical protein MNBD_NITROSPINAE01-1805 [hydrothermal vent metagenome]|uniref:Response regulatory domain-containing protein n=1 Tax=hydrothermal vent metagenome TaxID=652676 RepID=A0A3B1C5V0_9ZZZZ
MAQILVIEDDIQGREMLKQMLEMEGYGVAEAADGNEGATAFIEHSPELVITDIIMPNKGGLETIINLKRENPKVKIFAITGGGRVVKADFLTIAESIGATKTFKKPLDRHEIIAAVKEAVGEPALQ